MFARTCFEPSIILYVGSYKFDTVYLLAVQVAEEESRVERCTVEGKFSVDNWQWGSSLVYCTVFCLHTYQTCISESITQFQFYSVCAFPC